MLLAELPTGTWPCTACSAANDLADAACRECGTAFLAAARSAPPTVVLPVHEVWGLKLALWKRVGVCVIFLLGGL